MCKTNEGWMDDALALGPPGPGVTWSVPHHHGRPAGGHVAREACENACDPSYLALGLEMGALLAGPSGRKQEHQDRPQGQDVACSCLT